MRRDPAASVFTDVILLGGLYALFLMILVTSC